MAIAGSILSKAYQLKPLPHKACMRIVTPSGFLRVLFFVVDKDNHELGEWRWFKYSHHLFNHFVVVVIVSAHIVAA